MQPRQSKSDGFTPKWRHFHPQATVWVKNILDHDVLFQVADEHNNPYQYRMPKGRVSELPGGAIATLGVKKIVDELVMTNKDDAPHMWVLAVRKKYEDQIIVKEKQAPAPQQSGAGGEVNLVTNEEAFADEIDPEDKEIEEEPFADEPVSSLPLSDEEIFDDGADAVPVAEPMHTGTGAPVDPNVAAIAEASLAGKGDATLSAEA